MLHLSMVRSLFLNTVKHLNSTSTCFSRKFEIPKGVGSDIVNFKWSLYMAQSDSCECTVSTGRKYTLGNWPSTQKLGGLPYFVWSWSIVGQTPFGKFAISWSFKMRPGPVLGNSIGSMVHFLKLILAPCILSTRKFFKCVLSFGADCIKLKTS